MNDIISAIGKLTESTIKPKFNPIEGTQGNCIKIICSLLFDEEITWFVKLRIDIKDEKATTVAVIPAYLAKYFLTILHPLYSLLSLGV